jgi:hypothetical protein
MRHQFNLLWYLLIKAIAAANVTMLSCPSCFRQHDERRKLPRCNGSMSMSVQKAKQRLSLSIQRAMRS